MTEIAMEISILQTAHNVLGNCGFMEWEAYK